jgi:hypothetical protein
MPGTRQYQFQGQQYHINHLCHPTVYNEVLTIHERAFITGKKEDCLSLLDSFTEATRWEVDLAAKTLGLVVT